MKNIAIIALSGCIEEPEKLELLKDFFNQKDMSVKIFPSCYKKYRYMAGDDTERLSDLHNAYLDQTIDTIICARGGYGTLRLLDSIDYNIIKNNPKKLVGSSDITNLLLSIYKMTKQTTYHGKMALSGVLNMNNDEFEQYKNAIESSTYDAPIKADGILWGGNLTTIVALFGSNPLNYIPDDDIVLFVEDINEPTYKIDRMLVQILRNIALCNKIKGVIFGEFIGAGKYLDVVLNEFTQALNVPFGFDKRITHGAQNVVVPIGKKIQK